MHEPGAGAYFSFSKDHLLTEKGGRELPSRGENSNSWRKNNDGDRSSSKRKKEASLRPSSNPLKGL